MRLAFCTRLARGALQEIVDRRRDEQRRRARSGDRRRRNAHDVAMHDVAQRRLLARDLDERLAGVRLAPRREHVVERTA